VRFAAIYFISLLTGSFGALVVTAGPTVGASGAIFGLMAAAALVLRSRGIGIMESGLGIWIALNLLITFAVPGISVGGHIGGLIGGAISAYVLFDLRQRLRVPDALPAVFCGVVAALAVVGSIMVSSGA
jgi:membrane associated rhomboid family serine protease